MGFMVPFSDSSEMRLLPPRILYPNSRMAGSSCLCSSLSWLHPTLFVMQRPEQRSFFSLREELEIYFIYFSGNTRYEITKLGLDVVKSVSYKFLGIPCQ